MFKLNLELLKKANECKGTDEVRFYTNGVFVKYSKEQKQMIYVATNGHILYKGVEDVDYDLTKEELKKLETGFVMFYDFKKIKKYTEIISCEFVKEDCLLIKCYYNGEAYYLSIRLLEGNLYPNYEKVIVPDIDNKTKKYNQKNIKVGYVVFSGLYLEKMRKMGANLHQPIKWDKEERSPYRFNINDKELIMLMPIK